MRHDRFLSLVAELFSVEEDELEADTRFVEDLGADSLDALELRMILEEEYGVTPAEVRAISRQKTVGQVSAYLDTLPERD